MRINLSGPRMHPAVSQLSRVALLPNLALTLDRDPHIPNDSRAHVRVLVPTSYWWYRTDSGEVHDMVEWEYDHGEQVASTLGT